MRTRADALDAEVAVRTEAYEGYAGDTRHGGDRDCDASEELARRYPDPMRIEADEELVRAVDDALRCRRTWNGNATVFGHLLVFHYLAAPGASAADACVLRAARALRLADRLASSRNTRSELFDPALAQLLQCAERTGPETHAQALAEIRPLVEDPLPAWYATEAVALSGASVSASALREHANVPDLVRLAGEWAGRPSRARVEIETLNGHDARGREVLAIASASRQATDADLWRLVGRVGSLGTCSWPDPLVEPLHSALRSVLDSRARVRAAVVALDPSRAGHPGLGSPWTGTPMRVRRDATGVSVEYDGPGHAPIVLRADALEMHGWR